jgi:hypothetical protein
MGKGVCWGRGCLNALRNFCGGKGAGAVSLQKYNNTKIEVEHLWSTIVTAVQWAFEAHGGALPVYGPSVYGHHVEAFWKPIVALLITMLLLHAVGVKSCAQRQANSQTRKFQLLHSFIEMKNWNW